MFFRIVTIFSLVAISYGYYTLDGRIVGGQATTIKSFPFQVSVQADEYPYHICGGSIIDELWILTAAHCTKNNYSYYVRVGSTYTYEGGKIYYASRVYNHPNFDQATFDSDISLLELSEPISINTGAKAIDLPIQYENPHIGSKLIILGWGATMDWTITDDSLRFVEVFVVNYNMCAKNFSNIDIKLTSTMFCAGYPGGGKDACSGDSGGPVIYRGKQIGIVSAGYKCADEEYPGIYTNVALFRDWIHNITYI